MFQSFDLDRPIIQRKYHDPDAPFNPWLRRTYHGYDYDPSTGMTDEEILAGLADMAPQWENLPHPVAKARAVEYVLQHTRIDVNDHDYFPGLYSWDRLPDAVTFTKWKEAIFSETLPQTKERMDRLNRSGAVAIWPDYDHVVPDWDSMLSLGFPGLLARAEAYRDAKEDLTPRQAAFFDGIILEYTAILHFLDRLIALAETKTGAKAPLVLSSLRHLRAGPPQNFLDALEMMYLFFMISESVDHYQVRSLGNGLDHSLQPFYDRDLAEGTFTRDQIREFLAYFMMQWSAIGNYWGQPFYLGGSNADGSCRISQLSHDIIDVHQEVGLYNPKIQIKLNDNTPWDFLKKVLDRIRKESASFVFCCEPGHWQAVMSYGATAEEAREFDLRGCYETGVRANEVCTATGYINPTKAVLYVLRNGWDETLGEQMGVKTGELSALKTFEDFFAAYLKQLEHLVNEAIRSANEYDPYMEEINPSSLYSATVESSLQNAFDGYQGGVKFNNSAVLLCGLASAVDSLMAVKEMVYDRGEIALEDWVKALDQNYEGYRLFRAKLLKSPHRYGSGDAEANALARSIADFYTDLVNGRKNGRGGVYKAQLHSALQFVRQGAKTGATPDGRLAGEELSKNASPVNGRDRNGITALVKTVTGLIPSRFPESFCLDLMLHPSAVQGEDGLIAMKGILDAYLKEGGMSVQFNLFDAATLRDAQSHPDKYQNLQVRVCGWNVLWNNLSSAEQNAYILRAENI